MTENPSEHVQPAPGQQPPPPPQAAAATAEHPSPGHDETEANFRLITWVGVGLVVTAVVIHLLIWWLFEESRYTKAEQDRGLSALALEDASRPLEKRLLGVPLPRLEGLEPETSMLVLDVEGQEQVFYAAATVDVHIHGEQRPLFALAEGERVTVTYLPPSGGAVGGVGIVVSVISPPEKEESGSHPSPEGTRRLDARIVKLEPRGVRESRAWAEAQMTRYGWAERKKDVARIPVADAMGVVLQGPEFRGAGRGAADKGPPAGLPSRASSGRRSVGGEP